MGCGCGMWRGLGGNLVLDAGRLDGGGFGGILGRFLGHTPSFRRFRRINHGSIAGFIPACWNQADCWASLMAFGVWLQPDPSARFNAFLGPDEELQYYSRDWQQRCRH